MKRSIIVLILSLLSFCETAPAQTKLTPVRVKSVDGALAVLQAHLDENAPDTLVTLKPKKAFSVNLDSGSLLQIYCESVVSADSSAVVVYTYFGISNNVITNTWTERDTVRSLKRRDYKRTFVFRADGVAVNVWCAVTQKTQTKFRVFLTSYPLFPDSLFSRNKAEVMR